MSRIKVTDKNSVTFTIAQLRAEYEREGGLMGKIMRELPKADQDLLILVCEVGSVRKIERLYGKKRNDVNARLAVIRQHFWRRILEIEKRGDYDI